MTDEVRNKINNIVLKDLQDIDTMPVGTEERTAAISDVETLVKLDIYDYEAASKAYKDEALLKTEQSKIKAETGVKIAGFGIGFLTTMIAIHAEHIGTYWSKLGLDFSKMFRPKM